MKNLNHKLIGFATQSGDLDFPGFKLQAFLKGQKIADIKKGKTYDYYDLASLTKIIFTTSVLINLVSQKKLTLSTKVKTILPWYKYGSVQVGQLLNHSAGNDWWQPFYAKVDQSLSPEEKFVQIQKSCRKAPLSKIKKSVYSDIDFYLLGALIEKLEKKPLMEVWNSYKQEYLPNSRLHFNYANKSKYKKTMYAPTEKCLWRKKIVQGEVHDENAWAMGGIAPQAGLFGRVDDLSDWGLKLRKAYKGEKSFLSPLVVRQFTKRSLPINRGDWAYGFMMPSRQGSSAGKYFSSQSFGHTGFTGISLWFDPKRDLLVSLVSNRIHPSRNNKGFVRLRPKLHDFIVEHLEGKQ